MITHSRFYDASFATPRNDVFVAVDLSTEGSAITAVDLLPHAPFVNSFSSSPLVLQAFAHWLDIYFSDPICASTLPLQYAGTPFQNRIWRHLQAITLGTTCRYGEIAQHLNTSARAVGNACRANPLSLVVPCHRVVSAQGIGGYAGATSGWKLSVKAWLLMHERCGAA